MVPPPQHMCAICLLHVCAASGRMSGRELGTSVLSIPWKQGGASGRFIGETASLLLVVSAPLLLAHASPDAIGLASA